MAKPLPCPTDVDQLQGQAEDLQRAQRAGEPEALARIAEHLPRLGGRPAAAAAAGELSPSEALLVIAREHGFSSWPKLRDFVAALGTAASEPLQAFTEAVTSGAPASLRALLTEHPALRAALDEPLFGFCAPAVVAAKAKLAVVDVLLEHGADINARSQWWAGGFGVLDGLEPEAAAPLIERGARVDIHAAAALGQIEGVAAFLQRDPGLANARGGDGKRPLHVARTVEIIDLLLRHGADIDARDADHLATPAQYRVRERDLCRHLIARGAAVDIFMAAALGDLELARTVLDQDPGCVTARIGDDGYPPVPQAPGLHIYAYVMAPYHTPHQVAARLAPGALYDLLLERSPATCRLLAAFDRADAQAVAALLGEHPDLLGRLTPGDRRALALAAWDNQLDAVRVMLDAGMDPHAEGPEASTALDRAAWHGYAPIVALLLQRDPEPPLRHRNAHGATPLGACLHGSLHAWHSDGDHAAVAEMLLAAGSPRPDHERASAAVLAVLRRHAPGAP